MNKYKIEEILSNIQFQVYSDMNFIEPLGLDKETWKELLEYINQRKEVLDKIKEYIEENTQYYDKELGLVEMMGAGETRTPVIYLYGLLKLLEEIE